MNKPITDTKAWVNKVIVKYNICPFARQEVEKSRLRYIETAHRSAVQVLHALLSEFYYLDDHREIETTLFIIAEGFEAFYLFLDLVDMANELIDVQGYEGIYQLASFHPDYCFNGEEQSDASNYTNRSPYPTLHILRESTMEAAIASHPDADAIPARNIAFCQKKGNQFFAELLASCMK